jgi:thiopeptide-type bacteriocin biosynthesis protein
MTSPLTLASQVEDPPLASHEWVSAHVFYNDDLDPLLVEMVDPLVRELAGEVLTDGYFFIRYWDRGPHLRLRCRATAGNRAAVERRIVDRAGRFLSERPAATEVGEAGYRRYAAALTDRSRVPDHPARPLPTNSLAFIPYRPEHDRYGYGASMAAVERHFEHSSQIVLSLLVAGLTSAERNAAGLAMVLLAWFAAGIDPGRASQVAAWLADHGVTVDPAHHHRQRASLRRMAEQLRALTARSGDLDGAGSLLAWGRSVRSLHDTLVGTLDATEHRTPFSVVDTCAHLACNRLGLGLGQERGVRYLAAHTVSELGDTPTGKAGPAPGPP